jgi:hypothetical protein
MFEKFTKFLKSLRGKSDDKKPMHKPNDQIKSIQEKLGQTRETLAKTKEVLAEATNKIIKRGERIEDLVNKTANLQAESAKFRRKTEDMNDIGCFTFFTRPIKKFFKSFIRPASNYHHTANKVEAKLFKCK